jgi:hypothetical protein
MADTIDFIATKGYTLAAVYTYSDGSTQPASDAAWSVDSAAVTLSAASGATVEVDGIDAKDGSLTVTNWTVTGQGFTATGEIDVQATSAPVPTITGISVTSVAVPV